MINNIWRINGKTNTSKKRLEKLFDSIVFNLYLLQKNTRCVSKYEFLEIRNNYCILVELKILKCYGIMFWCCVWYWYQFEVNYLVVLQLLLQKCLGHIINIGLHVTDQLKIIYFKFIFNFASTTGKNEGVKLEIRSTKRMQMCNKTAFSWQWMML